MRAKVTIELENGEQVVLDRVNVEMSEEKGVAFKERLGSFTPDIAYNGQYRACIKVWRGCASYESFQARTEESELLDNVREVFTQAAKTPAYALVGNGVEVRTEGRQDDGTYLVIVQPGETPEDIAKRHPDVLRVTDRGLQVRYEHGVVKITQAEKSDEDPHRQ